jgi:enoyl-CoA hydratase/carnithine racemase
VLRIDDRERVRVITLDRPGARNAFNDDLYDGVRDALDEAARSPDLSVCVVAASGPVFSAGQDLKEFSRRRTRQEAAEHGFVPFAEALYAFDKPLLAAINGPAVGVGLTMLLHCDLVLVSGSARFRAPFVSLGIVPEAASSSLLPARVGAQAAAHLLFTGGWMDAEQAIVSGLAWRICPEDRLLDETLDAAQAMAALPLDALVATKRLLLAARSEPVAAAHQRELAELVRLTRGPGRSST